MKKNFAYETYKNVEASKNYKTPADRERYIRSMEKRTDAEDMLFLRKHLPPRLNRVLEVGSGSGRILHALLTEGRAQSAVGVEISPSRVQFGKDWAKKKKISNVEHIAGDILTLTPKGSFDAVLCMTTIFPFFDMLEKDGLRKVLKKIYALLNPGGTLVLESSTFTDLIKQCKDNKGSVKIWEEYRAGDPFQFHLMHYSWDEKKRHLQDVSYNLMRDRLFVDGPTTKRWHIEDSTSLIKKVTAAGFKHSKLFGGFDSAPYREGVSDRIILIAQK
jgi:SAM-dependent methyltransferase